MNYHHRIMQRTTSSQVQNLERILHPEYAARVLLSSLTICTRWPLHGCSRLLTSHQVLYDWHWFLSTRALRHFLQHRLCYGAIINSSLLPSLPVQTYTRAGDNSKAVPLQHNLIRPLACNHETERHIVANDAENLLHIWNWFYASKN